MNFSVEALQEMKNAALRQRTGAGAGHSLEDVQQSEEISSSQVGKGASRETILIIIFLF